MPVAQPGSRSHATLIAEAAGKAWVYGAVQHSPNGDKYQIAESWDGSIFVRCLVTAPSTVSDAQVTTNLDLAVNEYEASAILLGRRT